MALMQAHDSIIRAAHKAALEVPPEIYRKAARRLGLDTGDDDNSPAEAWTEDDRQQLPSRGDLTGRVLADGPEALTQEERYRLLGWPHPDIVSNPNITIVPLRPPPAFLQTSNKIWFMICGPLKVIFQIAYLWKCLAYTTAPAQWMMVQVRRSSRLHRVLFANSAQFSIEPSLHSYTRRGLAVLLSTSYTADYRLAQLWIFDSRLEIGPNDLKKQQTLTVRRDTGDKSPVSTSDIGSTVGALLDTIQNDMFNRAKTTYDSRLKEVQSLHQQQAHLDILRSTFLTNTNHSEPLTRSQIGDLKFSICGSTHCL